MAIPQPPIFLIGVARSGTTLLSLMLDAHSRIAIPYESHFIPKYAGDPGRVADLVGRDGRRRFVESVLAEPYVREWRPRVDPGDVDVDSCTSLAAGIDAVFRAYARKSAKTIWADKTPLYIRHVDVLNRLFPDCKFVHIVRDGRDVASSLVRQWWGPDDFVSALRYWREQVVVGRKMLSMLPPDRVHELRFEDLVARPGQELVRVTEFLAVPFEEDMLTAYRAKAAEKVGDRVAAHHRHLLEAASAGQSHKWMRELPAADQAIAHEVIGPILAEFGYAPGRTRHPLKQLRKGWHRVHESIAWRSKRSATGRAGPPPAPPR